MRGKPFYPPSDLVSPNMINLNMSWLRTHFLSPKEYIYTTPLDTRDIGEKDTKTVRGKREGEQLQKGRFLGRQSQYKKKYGSGGYLHWVYIRMVHPQSDGRGLREPYPSWLSYSLRQMRVGVSLPSDAYPLMTPSGSSGQF